MLPNNIPGRYHSITEYHAMYLSGQLTPLAVVESLLPFIRRDINLKSHHSTAFIDSHVDVILEAARASTLRYKEGKSLGILDGVPTAIKDESNLAGYRTTSGRKKNDAIFPVEDESAWSMLKWQEAGGIVLGKLNMHELGADTSNNNPNWGTPRNPHNDQVRLLEQVAKFFFSWTTTLQF
jgi:Asp-tRNA(Asn)/Glu-tRNA(Gln) amidotransferase A subunit family amidase